MMKHAKRPKLRRHTEVETRKVFINNIFVVVHPGPRTSRVNFRVESKRHLLHQGVLFRFAFSRKFTRGVVGPGWTTTKIFHDKCKTFVLFSVWRLFTGPRHRPTARLRVLGASGPPPP